VKAYNEVEVGLHSTLDGYECYIFESINFHFITFSDAVAHLVVALCCRQKLRAAFIFICFIVISLFLKECLCQSGVERSGL
jgi:hypothetical protein